MKRLPFFSSVAVVGIFLAGCQSKREVCADWSADQITRAEAAVKLGLTPKDHDKRSYKIDYEAVGSYQIKEFCSYYKN